MLLENQVAMLERVIQDRLSDMTKPRHRLAICKDLVKRTDELAAELNIAHAGKEDVSDFLCTPG
jgi:hypothetical protein